MSGIRESNGSGDSDPYAEHDIITSAPSLKLSSSSESESSTDSNKPYAKFENTTNDHSKLSTSVPLSSRQIAIKELLGQKNKTTLELKQPHWSPTQGIGDSGPFENIDLQDSNKSIRELVKNHEEFQLQPQFSKKEEGEKDTERKHEEIMLKPHIPEPGERLPDFSHIGNRLPFSKPPVINPASFDPENSRRHVRQDINPTIIEKTNQENLKKNNFARKWIITVLLCLCGAGGLTWILHNQRVINSEDPSTTPRTDALIISDCQESGAFGPIGEHVCYAPASNCSAILTTERIKRITIRQGSSTYYKFVTSDYVSVLFTEDKFNAMYKGWFIDYNISREIQPLRIGKLNMTCYDIGVYTMTLHYGKSQNHTCKFKINTQNPEIKLSTNETEDFIYINCTMSNVCSEATLAVYINDGNHTYPVLAAENNCHSNTSMKRKEIALQKSQFSTNHKVICKPLIDDINLMENLTKTIPLISRTITLCNESQCPNFCTIEEQGYYFQHPLFCNKFYQCEYPTLHLRPCPENQQWNPEMCTCTLANKVIDQCNNATKKYDPVLATGNVKMCGGS